MSLDTKFLLEEIDKLFAKQSARWDRLFTTREGTLPVQISTELPAPAAATTTSPPTVFPNAAAAAASFVAPPEGANVGREVPFASRVVPTSAGMAEIIDIKPTDEIHNGFVDIEPTDEIRSDGCLTLAVVAPSESVAGFPIVASTNPEFAPMPSFHIPRCGALHRLEFGIPAATCLTKLRESSCTIARVDTSGATVRRAMRLPDATLIHTAKGEHFRCSTDCSNGVTSMLTTTMSSCTPTWMLAEVVYNFGKRLWPPPPLAPVLSKQGMHKLVVVGPLTDAKLNVIWSKSPWPPLIQWFMQAAGTPLRPMPWPSFVYFADHWAVLWILWKIPWLCSALMCGSSNAFAAETIITRAHMLFQFCPSRFEFVLQWPVIQPIPTPLHSFSCSKAGTHYEHLSTYSSNSSLVELHVSISATEHILQAVVLVSAACQWDRQWLLLGFLQRSFRNVPSDKCICNKDREYGLWIQWEIPWFQSPLVCWSADSFDEVIVITSILSQYYSSSVEFVLQWPFLFCLHWPSRVDSVYLWGGQHKQSGEVMKRGSVQLVVCILWDFWHPFLADGHMARAALGGFSPDDILLSSDSYMVILLHIFNNSSHMVSAALIQCHEWDVKLHLHWKYTVLLECCDFEAVTISDQSTIVVPLQFSVRLLGCELIQPHADGEWCYMPYIILLWYSISFLWIKAEVHEGFYPCLIAEFMFRVKVLLLAASFLVIKLVTSIRYLQVPWDPGGMNISYRLGGKPIFKKGRMLGSQYLWAMYWACIRFGPVCLVHWAQPMYPSYLHIPGEVEGEDYRLSDDV